MNFITTVNVAPYIWLIDELIAFQVAKDSSVEKAIDKIKNWYFEKEGNIYCLMGRNCFISPI